MNKVTVIAEHEDYLLVNKPAGLVVHADGRQDEPTLAGILAEQYPELKAVGEPMIVRLKGEEITIDRPGIVHRLDRDTSGVMIVARNQEAFYELKELFQKREVDKTYLALVYSSPKEDSGVVNAPLGRSPKDFRRWSAQPGARGQLREAITEWKVAYRFADAKGELFCLFVCHPQTGRTHQIRAHAKYMHHPIVSDPLYSGKRKPALGMKRQGLHALRISFPWKGEEVIGIAPIADDIRKALELGHIPAETLEKLEVSGIV